uniref:Uncharacterized protein n=1 Tax=Ditylenchus dipsaci TaxID=166011 RepID=A0A915DNQ1_9BILA
MLKCATSWTIACEGVVPIYDDKIASISHTVAAIGIPFVSISLVMMGIDGFSPAMGYLAVVHSVDDDDCMVVVRMQLWLFRVINVGTIPISLRWKLADNKERVGRTVILPSSFKGGPGTVPKRTKIILKKFPRLHKTVTRDMMHGPCGTLKMDSVCMAEDKQGKRFCSKRFPKEFRNDTAIGNDSYALYARPEDGENF